MSPTIVIIGGLFILALVSGMVGLGVAFAALPSLGFLMPDLGQVTTLAAPLGSWAGGRPVRKTQARSTGSRRLRFNSFQETQEGMGLHRWDCSDEIACWLTRSRASFV